MLMSKLKELYYQYIYGVIGTLAFHIILFCIFLFADLGAKHNFKDEGIILDFEAMEQLEELLEEEEKAPEEETQEEQLTDESSQASAPTSNLAVNKADDIKREEMFDAEYLKELEAAQRLVEDVNNQLNEEIPDLDDMEMPSVSTEDTPPDSIKNVINYGESKNTYFLENRYHSYFPIPTYMAEKGGVVTINITVNRKGKVISAEAQDASANPNIVLYAKAAALKTRFNADPNAANKQMGTITYTFIRQ
ncbi:energy transducer TonB [Puteibacter caeruleilacunae]|nr:energy transducer TonB [Puteibacter caeruleilacunae]